MAKTRLEEIDPAAELLSDTVAQNAADIELPKPPAEVLRPSEVQQMVAEASKEPTAPATGVDPHRYLRENGLPVPLRKFRVTSNRGMEAVELEACDEGEAIRQAAIISGIPQNVIHTQQFRCVLIAG